MSEQSPRAIINTMLECIRDVFEFTNGHNFESFVNDKKTKYAVLRSLEVIGEAANRLPKELRNQHPEIEWGRIIRSRNFIIHEYNIIDYTVIWRIKEVHLPPLQTALEKIIIKEQD